VTTSPSRSNTAGVDPSPDPSNPIVIDTAETSRRKA
jgi:hypothetical protein